MKFPVPGPHFSPRCGCHDLHGLFFSGTAVGHTVGHRSSDCSLLQTFGAVSCVGLTVHLPDEKVQNLPVSRPAGPVQRVALQI